MAFVRIALDGAGSYVKLELRTADDVSDLAKRVSAEFPHWGTPDKLALFLVAAGGKDTPPPSAMASARCLDQTGWSLEEAGVPSGAWLVARRRPHLLPPPSSRSRVLHSVIQGAQLRLGAAALRLGNCLFSGATRMLATSGASPAPVCGPGLLARQQPLDPVNGRLPRRSLSVGVGSDKDGDAAVKEE